MKTKVNTSLDSIAETLPIFSSAFWHETDRGVCIVVAGYLDDLLGALLRQFFVEKPKVVKDLLEGQGAIATFSSRINLSYCVGMLRQDQFDDLHTVRKIRNEFAHDHQPLSFDEPPLCDLCDNLKQLKLGLHLRTKLPPAQIALLFDNFKTRKQKFIGTAIHLTMGIHARAEDVVRCKVGAPPGPPRVTEPGI